MNIRWLGATPAEIGVAKLQLITWAKGNASLLSMSDYGFNVADLTPAWTDRDSSALGSFSNWWNAQSYQPKLPTKASQELSDVHRLALAQWAGGEAPTALQIPGWPAGVPIPALPPEWTSIAANIPWPLLGNEKPPGWPSFFQWPPPAPPGWPAGVAWPPPLPALPGPTSVPVEPPAPAAQPFPPPPTSIDPKPPGGPIGPTTQEKAAEKAKTKKSGGSAILWVLGGVAVVGVLALSAGGIGELSSNPKWRVGDKVLVYAPGTPWNGREGTIVETHTRRSTGTIRYTVKVGDREIYLSYGSLRVPS